MPLENRDGRKRAAAYLRVSTATKTRHDGALTFDQDPAVQEHPIRELIANRGWGVISSLF